LGGASKILADGDEAKGECMTVPGDWKPGDEERARRVLDFLESKGFRGCPICGEDEFGVGERHAIMTAANPAEASAVLPVLCGNCGYMMFFGTRMLPDEEQ
jgi:hypothetical protein